MDRYEDVELLRRKFLGGVAAAAAAYLAGGDQPPPLSAEGLQVIRADLDARWRHYQAGQTAEIEQVTALDADRLVRALKEAPESSKLYRPLAAATTEVAMLAGVVASDQGDDVSAAHWHETSTLAAKMARNADLVSLTLEDQAWVADFVGQSGRALGLLSLMPVRRASPSAVARVELGRAGLLAKAGNARASLTALDVAAGAADRARSEPSLLPRPPVTDDRLVRFRGQIQVDLAIDGAYRELKLVLRAPGVTERHKGIIHVYLARAAVQSGAIDRACWHASKAHTIFTTIEAKGQVTRVTQLLERDLAPFTSVRAVQDLEEQLRTGPSSRYMLCRTSDEGTKIHLRSCQYARRGSAQSWAKAEHLDPAELAMSPLRNGYGLCKRCLPQ